MLNVPYLADGGTVPPCEHTWVYVSTDRYEGVNEDIYWCNTCYAYVYVEGGTKPGAK